MDDQTLSHSCNHIVFDYNKPSSICESDRTLETAICDTEQVGENTALVDDSDVSDGHGAQEMCSDEVQTLPILQKFEQLSNQVQNLKKEHAALCNEVNGITANSFPGSEVFSALQDLSTEHEHLKKKYHEECELVKKKYLEECSERKRLYNEVIELKGNIRVFCRCRPLSQDEIANGSTSVVDFDSSQENELQIICSDSSRKQFKFDHVFRPDDNQEAVFIQTSPIVTSVLDGYNVCIFAYGQTGTGKTFTMEGTPENRGVNYRTLEDLFRISNERSGFMRYELFVSMLEVYNEKIRDLLIENSNQSSKKLEIKQAADGTQEVPGLVEAHVYGTDEVWELLKSGSQARSVGSTNANEFSSRSHCLLRVTVNGESLINGQKTKSHLWLVDLAGSERMGRIEVEGERLKESQFINKSLSALGDVISALASKTAHIPYRNSKLTHMLQSSLGGDCKTLMFVQISPSAVDLGETLCSLNFASRVRGIEHGPARKQADLTELFKYKQLAEKAKHDEKEIKKLRDSLQSLQLRLAAREHICRNFQDKNRELESQLAEERKTRLKQETRALASVSAQSPALSSLNQPHMTTIAEKKPPMFPSKLRLPLRGISNFLPPRSPVPPRMTKTSTSIYPNNKENVSKMMTTAAKTKTLLKARRGSYAVRPPPVATNKVFQPKRRASIATLHPESNSNIMRTPLNSSSNARLRTDRMVSRQSFVWDPQRVWRASRVETPLSRLKESAVMATPIAPRSSKFRGSPPTQAGSWKPKHPTVIALQKKQLVWSPLKFRGMRNSSRKSLLPS
ncbi:kinesin-like protein KIN-14S [Camellia sinensis]|uniref:kinesin-like protein KIN-14S n=1 Tax=Camellia sinensis TaxID=4442 RepID=UPI001035F995|nr:kinesin-like protein KIN-14S [Camellia sinensis]